MGKKRSSVEIDTSLYLCCECVGEPFLKAEIAKNEDTHFCFNCEEKNSAVPITVVADRIGSVIWQHYELGAGNDSPSDYPDGEPVASVIADLARIDDDVAEKVRMILWEKHSDFERDQMGEIDPYAEDTHYNEADVNDMAFTTEWEWFENNLKTTNRFFGLEGVLQKIFGDVNKHKTDSKHSVVTEVGPGLLIKDLFRARVIEPKNILPKVLIRPDVEIGPPPFDKAVEGRMNARGISVFYGAMNSKVAIAEVRPPIGSKVIVARFEILQKLRLLDIEALRSIEIKGSLFDPEHGYRLEHKKFLSKLSHRISMPVMRSDESSDYLVTQAIADYLANSVELNLDGIIYPSVYGGKGQHNVVLFHKSSKVLLSEFENVDVNIGYHTEDGYEEDYSIFEYEADSKDQEKPKSQWFIPPDTYNIGDDKRTPVLRLVQDSIEVHSIKGVTVDSESNKVRRHKLKGKKNQLPQF